MLNLTFAKESVLRVADEIMPLLELHYEEVALHKDSIKLDPDWARYVAMEEQGNCHVYTLRDGVVLVGYAVFFMSQHIHYQRTLVASNDILFIHPMYRRGTAALRFIKYCEEQVKNRGVNKITWHVKKHNDWSAILHRIGYETEETIVGKIL
jgi:GNAT superfamily N-acetyltransferase